MKSQSYWFGHYEHQHEMQGSSKCWNHHVNNKKIPENWNPSHHLSPFPLIQVQLQKIWRCPGIQSLTLYAYIYQEQQLGLWFLQQVFKTLPVEPSVLHTKSHFLIRSLSQGSNATHSPFCWWDHCGLRSRKSQLSTTALPHDIQKFSCNSFTPPCAKWCQWPHLL